MEFEFINRKIKFQSQGLIKTSEGIFCQPLISVSLIAVSWLEPCLIIIIKTDLNSPKLLKTQEIQVIAWGFDQWKLCDQGYIWGPTIRWRSYGKGPLRGGENEKADKRDGKPMKWGTIGMDPRGVD